MTTDAIKFTYDGSKRLVDNITVEGTPVKTVIGFEMRKGGKFSYRIKRYSFDKMRDLEFIQAPRRSGPKVGRP